MRGLQLKMDQQELGRTLGRLEEGIKGIDNKLDQAMVPAIKMAHQRIDKIEKIIYVATGIVLASGTGLAVTREVLIGWLKKKLGIQV